VKIAQVARELGVSRSWASREAHCPECCRPKRGPETGPELREQSAPVPATWSTAPENVLRHVGLCHVLNISVQNILPIEFFSPAPPKRAGDCTHEPPATAKKPDKTRRIGGTVSHFQAAHNEKLLFSAHCPHFPSCPSRHAVLRASRMQMKLPASIARPVSRRGPQAADTWRICKPLRSDFFAFDRISKILAWITTGVSNAISV